MANLPRRVIATRGLIKQFLVDSGATKAEAKKFIKQKQWPSPSKFSNTLYKLYIESLKIEMNDYAKRYGTAIDINSATGTNATLTQVIASSTGNPSNNYGMDGSGDYYNQGFFNSVNALTIELGYSIGTRFHKISRDLRQLGDDVSKAQLFISKKYGPRSEPSRILSEVHSYIKDAYWDYQSLVADATVSQAQNVLGPYYSQLAETEDVLYSPPKVFYEQTGNYDWYTTGVEWQNKEEDIDIIFAVQGVATTKENTPANMQALSGDSTISFTETLSMDRLYLLGAAANGNQLDQDVIINYSDGTSDSFILSFTDWANNANTKSKDASTVEADLFEDEYLVSEMSSYISQDGGVRNDWRYLFGYSIDVDSTLMVSSIQLNFNDNVKILAATYT